MNKSDLTGNDTIPSLEEAREYIYSKKFDMVIKKMVKMDGWIPCDAEEACRFFRNFIFLTKKYHEYKLVPSEDIDEFWHATILDSDLYFDLCNNVFGHGKYLKHYPYFGLDDKTTRNDVDQGFALTQELHMKEFNTPIKALRSKFPPIVYWLLKKIT